MTNIQLVERLWQDLASQYKGGRGEKGKERNKNKK